MKKVIGTALIAFLLCTGASSQNYVPNPSFETYSSCPTDVSLYLSNQMNKCTGWDRATGGGTSDYFNACNTTANTVDVPSSYFGTQSARTGDAYAGLILYQAPAPAYREYIMIQLTSPLPAGLNCDISFYVNLADNAQSAIDGIGAYISTGSVYVSGTYSSELIYSPQAVSPTGTYITDETSWTLVSGSFVTSGGENYLTIGNFRTAANTGIAAVSGTQNWAYYFIDDVSVTTTTLPVNLVSFQGYIEAQKVLLKWVTGSEHNNAAFIIERSSDGKIFSSLGELQGSEGSSSASYSYYDNKPFPGINYYRLKQVDYDGNFSHSETISVTTDNTGNLHVFPNPATEVIYVQADYKDEIYIQNISGQKMLMTPDLITETPDHLYNVNISRLPRGIYFACVNNNRAKFIRQ